jgi:SPP1 family phage portal protein
MISRLETISSNHADVNDYFGSPMLKVKGTLKGFAQKGESGKTLELEDLGDADFLSWDSSPESMKSEKDDLKINIYSMSQTPDISFEKLMTIAGNISGVALKLMFLDAHMAVKNKEEIFGIGLQRRLNLIKAAIGMVIEASLSNVVKTLQLKPVITPYLPQNVTEMIDNLSVATTAGIISKETAVEINPLVEDPETEIERLKEDATNELAGQQQIVSEITKNQNIPQ